MSSSSALVGTVMSDVEVNITVSVDGFVTGPDPGPAQGLGAGGEPLHDWLSHDEGRRLSAATFAAAGAVVTSRTVYDLTGGWGADGLYRMPVFVVTHRPSPTVRKGDTTFTFVEGVPAAISAAIAAAAGKDVHVMGGASIARQVLSAGLATRLRLHVAPMLLGAGTPLFNGAPPARLTHLETVDTPFATHITYSCA
ncbi:dihydrofolate reductase family protein [Dactylosporangium darangshiense]|uniref:Dihydrofolate reductase family protein n=1 Tax=Dactylosporangium darangshiense TaxID=579108 RepID=A0ABP8DNE0_9ACTN